MTDEAVLGTRSLERADDDEQVVERALVDRARTDRGAFAALYRMHVDAVYRFAYRRCGSREVAEEATSATFERALRSMASFEWRGNGVRPWLLRIASNEVAEIYRGVARADGRRAQIALRELSSGELSSGELSDGTDLDGGDPTDLAGRHGVDMAAMHAAIDRLPERYRAVISLRYLAGMSADAAATELQCSNRVLAVTLHRALAALRREMDRDARGRGER